MSLNASSHCKCGAAKPIALQWCDDCWKMIPRHQRESFIQSVHKLTKEIRVINTSLYETAENRRYENKQGTALQGR